MRQNRAGPRGTRAASRMAGTFSAARHVPGIAVQERRDDWRVDDSILVRLGNRVVAGVEVERRLLDGEHAHVERQDGVEGAAKRGRVMLVADSDAGDLRARMHACVSTTGAVNGNGSPLERHECFLQEPLNRHAFGLTLPADVVRTVIFDGQLQGPHGRSRVQGVQGGSEGSRVSEVQEVQRFRFRVQSLRA